MNKKISMIFAISIISSMPISSVARTNPELKVGDSAVIFSSGGYKLGPDGSDDFLLLDASKKKVVGEIDCNQWAPHAEGQLDILSLNSPEIVDLNSSSQKWMDQADCQDLEAAIEAGSLHKHKLLQIQYAPGDEWKDASQNSEGCYDGVCLSQILK